MSPLIGWSLALATLVAASVGWGWRGAVLAITLISFWLAVQLSRALRVLRTAGRHPKGLVDNAVMFNARLRVGLQMLQVLQMTRSLGEHVEGDAASAEEAWRWRDAGGDAVLVRLRNGRVSAWVLERAPTS